MGPNDPLVSRLLDEGQKLIDAGEKENDALRKQVEVLEGTMQTALDLLKESAAHVQLYDFRARREVFIKTELQRRTRGGR